jgi:dCMP deaminase
MFIVVTGTRCAGKATIQDYLAFQKGFTILLVEPEAVDPFTSVPTGGSPPILSGTSPKTLIMPTRPAMLDYVTRNWQTDFVTTALDGTRPEILAEFTRRPFCTVLHVDAPVLLRWQRAQDKATALGDTPAPSLEQFLIRHDNLVFGESWADPDDELVIPTRALLGIAPRQSAPIAFASSPPTASVPTTPGQGRPLIRPTQRPSLIASAHLVNLRISNRFSTKEALYAHLDGLDIIRPDRLRPSWDDYFMTLAELASRRSNCMKRRVGAILVRAHHIVATGFVTNVRRAGFADELNKSRYNGTSRGLTNCRDGGCPACNLRRIPGEEKLNECICLHAEENALLEAGRDRVSGSTLYCNTCPCLRCSVKIIQTGVKEVVYNHSYKV